MCHPAAPHAGALLIAAEDSPADAPRPLLRGLSHLVAFFAALAGWVTLVRAAPGPRGVIGGTVFGASLAVMFGVSALYHIPRWPPALHGLLRRVDHAAIFVLIAGTYAPLCLALEPRKGLALLAFVCTCALFGIVRVFVFPDAPRYASIPIYLALGWAVTPLVQAVRAALGSYGLALLAVGGLVYSLGAIIYWIRRPDPAPAVFGYREIFHLLVVGAAACHYAVILGVVRGLS